MEQFDISVISPRGGPPPPQKVAKKFIFGENLLFPSSVSTTSGMHVRCFGSFPEPFETIFSDWRSKQKFLNFSKFFKKYEFYSFLSFFPGNFIYPPETMAATI